jgi:hypothetical protein
MDKDILALVSKLEDAKLKKAPASSASVSAETVEQAIQATIGGASITSIRCEHTPPTVFRPGEPLTLSVQVGHSAAPVSAHLCYRHVNQGERWLKAEMESGHGGSLTAAVPGGYTQSEYPLQYYFELRAAGGAAWLYPVFNSTLSNQPYFAVSARSV